MDINHLKKQVRRLRKMLRFENTRWEEKKRSKTLDNVQEYLEFCEKLLQFIENEDQSGIQALLSELNEESAGKLQKCFRTGDGVEGRRKEADGLLKGLREILHSI